MVAGISLTPFLTFFIKEVPNIDSINIIYIKLYMNDYNTRQAFKDSKSSNKIDALRKYLILLRLPVLIDLIYLAGFKMKIYLRR